MYHSHLKVAIRNIYKNGFYSILNILGLFSAILFVLLIFGFGWRESEVNESLKDYKNQYILYSIWKDPSQGPPITAPAPLAKTMHTDLPSLIENYYRSDNISSIVSVNQHAFEENLQIGDSTFLNMYGFKLLYGSKETVFKNPYSIVITVAKALKLFGKEDVVGKTLSIANFAGTHHPFTITGVLSPLKENSVTSLNVFNINEMFLGENSIKFFERDLQNWSNIYIISFIQLKPGVRPESLSKPIKDILSKYAPASISKDLTIKLISLKDFYAMNNQSKQKLVSTLFLSSIFILIMAMINFINTSNSQSGSRMREIGVRKVLGALKTDLLVNYLSESILIAIGATLLSVGAYPLVTPYFNDILNTKLPSLFDFPLYFIPFLIVFAIIVGLIAGLFPAIIVSSFKTVDSLRGKLKANKKALPFQKLLVGFQFFSASTVLIAAIIITEQINLFLNSNLGYQKEFVVSVKVPRDWSYEGVRKMETLKRTFQEMSEIESATLSYEIPDGMNGGSFGIYRLGTDTAKAINSQMLVTDESYALTYKIPLASGTFFQSGVPDSTAFVINETESKALGWLNPNQAIGERVRILGLSPEIRSRSFVISGVVKDFHFGPLGMPIENYTFIHPDLVNIFRYFSFKMTATTNLAESINSLQKKWSVLLPDAPFEYQFMDETLEHLYENDIQLKKGSYAAAVIAIITALLGVLGLTSLSIKKRKKEIAIRKLLGTTIEGILMQFLREFIPIIIIAGMISWPLVFILMRKWLNDYVYRIQIGILPFLLSTMCIALLASLLIIAQTYKIASSNLTKGLRQ